MGRDRAIIEQDGGYVKLPAIWRSIHHYQAWYARQQGQVSHEQDAVTFLCSKMHSKVSAARLLAVIRHREAGVRGRPRFV